MYAAAPLYSSPYCLEVQKEPGRTDFPSYIKVSRSKEKTTRSKAFKDDAQAENLESLPGKTATEAQYGTTLSGTEEACPKYQDHPRVMPLRESEASAREDCTRDSTPDNTLGTKRWSSVEKRDVRARIWTEVSAIADANSRQRSLKDLPECFRGPVRGVCQYRHQQQSSTKTPRIKSTAKSKSA